MTNRRDALTRTPLLMLVALVALPVSGSAQEAEAADFGYGYYRTIEGEAWVTGLEKDAEPLEAEPNYPVLTGDHLWVTERARLESVLPDRSILRIAGGSEVYFESLAGSADAPEGASTVLKLIEGELQLESRDSVLASEFTLVETHNARIYVEAPGNYRLVTDGRGWTEVVVREGFAEVNTERGSAVGRAGESIEVDGTTRPEVQLARAGGLDELEQWGYELSDERVAEVGYVDRSLAYAAAPLARSGHWISISGGWAWRPSVRVGWRPFTDGWWTYTPSGLSWVAYEPWGWVTSHYGAWDYVPGHGWLWFPGSVYSPAWVYWYWGPTHTAWIPSGYYTRYYGPRFGFSFRSGVYGWAGGYWDSWNRWTFCPTRYFGHRRYRSYWRSGHEMHRDGRLHAVPRGVVTTDTRDITPRRWGRPSEIVEALDKRHGRGATTRTMTDVTPFVERRPDLPERTRRLVQSDSPTRRADASPGERSRGPAGSISGSSGAPWKVERPERVRSAAPRELTPRAPSGSRSGTGTDWELIERLRRFENKQEGVARTPQAAPPRDSQPRARSVRPRPETPTRRILDGVRSRAPQGAQRPSPPPASRRSPVTKPPTQRRPSSATPSRPSSSSRGSVRQPAQRSGSSRGSSSMKSSGSSSSKSSASRSSARQKKN